MQLKMKTIKWCLIDDEKLLEKYKTICTNIEDLNNIELNTLPVFDDRYVKRFVKVYTNFCGLNVPEDNIEWESFTVISIDSLLVYKNKYYPQEYLHKCAYKIVEKRIIDYLFVSD